MHNFIKLDKLNLYNLIKMSKDNITYKKTILAMSSQLLNFIILISKEIYIYCKYNHGFGLYMI